MLVPRVVSALLFGPLLLWAAWVGGWALFVLVVLIVLVAHKEMVAILRRRDICIVPVVGPLAMGLVLVTAWQGSGEQFAIVLATAGILPLMAFVLRPGVYSFSDAAFSLMEVLYIGVLAGYWLRLRLVGDGRLLVVAVLLTWAYDVAAYFSGRAWGRRKIVPLLSPKKTWEGALGGAVTTMGMALVLSFSGFMEWGVAVGAGLIVSIFAPLGDLIESGLKRYASVKDAGRIIPGHGGVLDRFDSLLLTGFSLYVYFLLVLGR